jgi:hypothetical protein
MHIDTYAFGRITIDGVEYTSDCLIMGDTVQPNWWRRQGHLLSPDDIRVILEREPDTLVVGCGASSMMKIDPATDRVLEQSGIAMEAFDTRSATERFNTLSGEGANVAAALHLTC